MTCVLLQGAAKAHFTSILSATPSVPGRLGVGGIMSLQPFRVRPKTAATLAPGAGALRIIAATELARFRETFPPSRQ